jgi:hypothetical protein
MFTGSSMGSGSVKGPVHPLLELQQPRDPVPIPLPENMGLYSVIDTYL